MRLRSLWRVRVVVYSPSPATSFAAPRQLKILPEETFTRSSSPAQQLQAAHPSNSGGAIAVNNCYDELRRCRKRAESPHRAV